MNFITHGTTVYLPPTIVEPAQTRTIFYTYTVAARPVVALQVINARFIQLSSQHYPESQRKDAVIISLLLFDPVDC
jgi:hypothetical protein